MAKKKVMVIEKDGEISVAKPAQNVSGVFEYQVLMIKSGKKAKGKLSLTPEEVYPGVLRRAISASEGDLCGQLHDAFAGAALRATKARTRGQRQRRERHRVIGLLDAVDVGAIEQVERFPDQLRLGPALDGQRSGDARVDGHDGRQAKGVAPGSGCKVVAVVTVVVEIHGPHARRVRQP